MKILKNVLGVILVISVLLPMFLFLNPFAWGMRRAPEYIPSEQLEKILEGMKNEINQYEDGVVIDTYDNKAKLWYFRDCENEELDSLDNFKIEISEIQNDSFVKAKIKKYAPLIQKEIGCKCYDSLIFTYKKKENESEKFVSEFKIK